MASSLEVYRGDDLRCRVPGQALGEYLDEKFLTDKTLIQAHEAPQLVPGRSYTVLEHTWDLAYGYYLQVQKLLQSNSLTGLRGSETKLFNAFALGRLAITEYRYEEALSHLRSIRTLLAQAVAARAPRGARGTEHPSQPQRTPRRCLPLRLTWCRLSLRPAVHSSPQW